MKRTVVTHARESDLRNATSLLLEMWICDGEAKYKFDADDTDGRSVNCSVTFVLGNFVGNDNAWWTGDTTRRYPSLIRVNNRVQRRRRPCLTSNRNGLRRFVLCVRARHTFHAPSNDLVWKSGKKTKEKIYNKTHH